MENFPDSSEKTNSKVNDNIEISKEEINKTDIEEDCKDFSQMLVDKAEIIKQFQSNYNALNKQFKEDNNNTEYSLDTIPNKQGIKLEQCCTEETNKLRNIIDSATTKNIPEICDKCLKVLNNIISVLENISEDYENHIIYGIIQDTKSRLKDKIEMKEYFDKLYVAEKLTLSSLKQFHRRHVMQQNMNEFVEACNALNNELLIMVLPHVPVYGLNKFLQDYLKTLQNISPDDYTRRKKHMKRLLKEKVHVNIRDKFFKNESRKYAKNVFHAL